MLLFDWHYFDASECSAHIAAIAPRSMQIERISIIHTHQKWNHSKITRPNKINITSSLVVNASLSTPHNCTAILTLQLFTFCFEFFWLNEVNESHTRKYARNNNLFTHSMARALTYCTEIATQRLKATTEDGGRSQLERAHLKCEIRLVFCFYQHWGRLIADCARWYRSLWSGRDVFGTRAFYGLRWRPADSECGVWLATKSARWTQ